MTSVSRRRRPLPRRVYWVRRLLVLSVAMALVLGIGRLLGGWSDATEAASAQTTAATGSPGGGTTGAGATSTTDPSGAMTGAAAEVATAEARRRQATKTPTPLAVPTGPCADSDVQVTPSVGDTPIAGTDTTITLTLTTLMSPACTWEVSSDSVVVKLTSGNDRIWSTQDCPSSISRQSVVVRRDNPTTVEVVWSGQRSDDECSRTTLWAQPGYYHATAAALGADPGEQQFELLTPPRPTITPTPVILPEMEKEARSHGRSDERRDRHEKQERDEASDGSEGND